MYDFEEEERKLADKMPKRQKPQVSEGAKIFSPILE